MMFYELYSLAQLSRFIIPEPWRQRLMEPNFQAALGYIVDTVSKIGQKSRKKSSILAWGSGVTTGNRGRLLSPRRLG